MRQFQDSSINTFKVMIQIIRLFHKNIVYGILSFIKKFFQTLKKCKDKLSLKNTLRGAFLILCRAECKISLLLKRFKKKKIA